MGDIKGNWGESTKEIKQNNRGKSAKTDCKNEIKEKI